MQKCVRSTPWLALVLLVTACASGPRQPAPVDDSDPGAEPAPAVDEATPEHSPPSSDGAVSALLRQAQGHYQRGEDERAIAAAERALRIDRRHAPVYLVLARSYLRQQQPRQAEAFARHGLRYGRDPLVVDALQEVLQSASEAQ